MLSAMGLCSYKQMLFESNGLQCMSFAVRDHFPVCVAEANLEWPRNSGFTPRLYHIFEHGGSDSKPVEVNEGKNSC